MKMSYRISALLCGVTFLAICLGFTMKQNNKVIHADITDYTKDLIRVTQLFPSTASEINKRVAYIKNRAQQEIDAIIAIPGEKRTFENTARALDTINTIFGSHAHAIFVLKEVHPSNEIREASLKASQEINTISIELFAQNVELYNAFKEYVEGNARTESLTQEQRYYLNEAMDDFEKSGLHLPEATRNTIKKLLKELSDLSLEFQQNINEDASTITVTREQLEGLDEDFINALEQITDGCYKVGVKDATVRPIFKYCGVADTRKRLYDAYQNRAYPQNKEVLEKIIARRDQLAHILGFESYAAFNIDNQMAHNPQIVESFLRDLIKKTDAKISEEIECIKTEMPPSVEFDSEGKCYPWDISFAIEYVKKKNYNVEERLIAEYFPMEKTVEALLSIYESFFNLEMKVEPVSDVWHEDVKAITVYKDKQVIGYLLLDLHPRNNKYSHACEISIVPGVKTGVARTPSVAVVLANFTKSTPIKPSLLYREEVQTFFHEFGHAIHAVLGATEMAVFSGPQVKRDFVEMPSQMLEEWLYTKDILKYVSSHYETGESLPDELIDRIIELKNFSIGHFIKRQAFYALLSLSLYQAGENKDIDQISAELHQEILHFLHYCPEHHNYAAFGHLTGYGARYYGYLWSKVFALDLFEYIKPHGLMNSEIGTVYAEKILSQGGSKDPNQLLQDFLGREPNQDAFLHDLGLM